MNSSAEASEIVAVFVYGTLKRGECRARLWPRSPKSIEPAWVRGCLFGRGDYPAMRPGGDRVRGELWRFSRDDMPEVLTTLDQIEGTNQPGEPDLYHRVVVDVLDEAGTALGRAFTYHYATDPLLDGFHRIESSHGGDVAWPE